MSGVEMLLLLVAGLGSGLAGSIAGLASLVSYPALLATGLGPVQANVTNTVALVFSSVGSTLGSQIELRGQAQRVARLAAAAVAGGAVGSGLLLVTPSETFGKIAPWFIAAAAVAILGQRGDGATRPARRGAPREVRGRLTASVFAVGIYGGYFGAAAGVVLLALFLAATRETLARANALKNVVLGIANATAAVAFVALAPVVWWAMVPLPVGLWAGGRLGPAVVRRANAEALKSLIGVAGLAVAVALGIDAYT